MCVYVPVKQPFCRIDDDVSCHCYLTESFHALLNSAKLCSTTIIHLKIFIFFLFVRMTNTKFTYVIPQSFCNIAIRYEVIAENHELP